MFNGKAISTRFRMDLSLRLESVYLMYEEFYLESNTFFLMEEGL